MRTEMEVVMEKGNRGWGQCHLNHSGENFCSVGAINDPWSQEFSGVLRIWT